MFYKYIFFFIILNSIISSKLYSQQISISDNSSFIIKSDGALWGWGGNLNGQLGDSTLISKNKPIRIGVDSNWSKISGGRDFTLAIKKDGTLWSWGSNQAGIGFNPSSVSIIKAPTKVDDDNIWIDVGVGEQHTIALKSNGTLWGWGHNNGNVGNGSTQNVFTPKKISNDSNWKSISVGAYHTLAIKSDGTLWAWGSNSQGQLGDSLLVNSFTPFKIGTDNDWQYISAGRSQSLAIKKDGTLWAWGADVIFGGKESFRKSHFPTKIGIENNWAIISAGSYYSFALKRDGTLWAWGKNNGGNIDSIHYFIGLPLKIVDSCSIVKSSIFGSYAYSGSNIIVKQDGSIWTWGSNVNGQLGISSFGNKNIFSSIDTNTNWVKIKTNIASTFGIKKDGTLWGWGENNWGQLGDSSRINKNSPVKIGGDNSWIDVSVGRTYTIGIKKDGSLWGWGYNFGNVLGNMISSIDPQTLPLQIGTEYDWVQVHASLMGQSFGIKKDGSLWAWGNDNSCGILGGSIFFELPTKISTSSWVNISLGDGHIIGIKKDKSIWAWGCNSYGELGQGNLINSNTPKQVGINLEWNSIASGRNHSAAISSDSSLWLWGRNYAVQNTSLASNINQLVPLKKGEKRGFKYTAANSSCTFSIFNDNSLWFVGENNHGLMGDTTIGSFSNIDTLLKVGQDKDWESISVGYQHAIAVKLNGKLYGSGDNYAGQIGDGTGFKSIPQNINLNICVKSKVNAIQQSFGISKCDTSFFNAVVQKKSDSLNYYWDFGDGAYSNKISPYHVFNSTNEYNVKLIVTDRNFASCKDSIITKIKIYKNPANFSEKNIDLCYGITYQPLFVKPDSNCKINWYDTLLIGGVSTLNLTPTTNKIGNTFYYFSQRDTISGCESNRSKFLVSIFPIPSTPTLSRDTASYLVSNTNIGNTWYKDGTALTDTTKKIKPTVPGSYTVKTTQNGCVSSLSPPYYYFVTDIINLSKDEFIKLAPNPFINQLNFDFLVKGYQRLNLEVFDIASGTKVASQPNLPAGTKITLGQLSAGTYVIRVTSTDNKISYQFKMVKL